MSGMSGTAIYENFKGGAGTGGLEAFADALVKLRRSYTERAQAIKKIQERMEAAWTGDAGSAATAGAGPLATALSDSATNMEQTFQSVTNQAQAWHKAANSVEPVPPLPEKPSFWEDIKTLGGASDNYMLQTAKHLAAAQHNVEVMSSYEAQTNSNQNFPRSYTTLSSAGGIVTVDTGSSASGVISVGSSSVPEARGGTPGTSGPGVATGTAPVTGSVPYSGRSGAGGASVTPSTPVGPTTPAPTPVAGGAFGTHTGDTRRGSGRSTTPRTPQRSTTGTGRGVGERAGARLYASRPGGGGASPTSGGAAGRLGEAPSAAKGGSLGAPRATGTGAVPGAAPTGGAAAGAAGGAGARGGAGMAPMGAGGGRGRGDEDKEHQRASYLQENDPDDAFIGDLGKTAPPVIGQ
ncbi:PPE family protein [Saccharomonospora glauca K62]|uniref:PPE family protein n=1 Tax=Saccharomonospora glauca K62 TaxID=928724 RepID=I1D5U4_9PSEU|nr:PPE family protein [Saccharomonospora glauca K62]